MKAEAEINKKRYAVAKTNKNFSSTQSREVCVRRKRTRLNVMDVL